MLMHSIESSFPCNFALPHHPESVPERALYEKVAGCLYGMVLGDAIGEPLEGLSRQQRARKFGSIGVAVPPADIDIGEDTRLAIAVALTLQQSGLTEVGPVMEGASKYFSRYAKGEICERGSRRLLAGVPWFEAGDPSAQGCGPALRAGPIGLYYQASWEKLVSVATAMTACTHAHPSAIASGIIAAGMTKLALGDLPFCSYPAMLLTLLKDQCAEMSYLLAHAHSLAVRGSPDWDQLGRGYRGCEAVALSMYFLICSGDSFAHAVRAAANGAVHSDAVAGITGAVAGTRYGKGAIPHAWLDAILPERREVIETIARELTIAMQGCTNGVSG